MRKFVTQQLHGWALRKRDDKSFAIMDLIEIATSKIVATLAIYYLTGPCVKMFVPDETSPSTLGKELWTEKLPDVAYQICEWVKDYQCKAVDQLGIIMFKEVPEMCCEDCKWWEANVCCFDPRHVERLKCQ